MKTVCEKDRCAGCMACLSVCPKQAITIRDGIASYNAEIDETRCVDCGLCHDKCQVNHPAEGREPIAWWQGWTKDAEHRQRASSGGIATSIEMAFAKAGGVVCSCTLEAGEFRFAVAEDPEQMSCFAGSKYVKSNPGSAYRTVKELLQNGRKVLFVALPCQVSAMKNYVGSRLQGGLYCVDLVCHGTPSPALLDMFLGQYGRRMDRAESLSFRTKSEYDTDPANVYFGAKGTRDCYTIAFLNAVSFTENCYHCQYASRKRVSDLTLGDSWGTDLARAERRRGVSLVLCQTEKGRELLAGAELELLPVDLEEAIASNGQLNSPSKMPKERSAFFRYLKDGNEFNAAVSQCFPKQMLKQRIKGVLLKLKLLKKPEICYGLSVRNGHVELK